MLPKFDDANVGFLLDNLKPGDFDALEFGAVKLTADGVVAFYSARERELSGYRGDPVGLNWLRDVAPCMDNPWFRERLTEAARGNKIDVEFETTGDFVDRHRVIQMRIVASYARGEIWFLLRRV